MAQYINYKESNPIYSPGIGAYSSKGEKGDSGNNGSSIYFNPNSIKRNAQEYDSINAKIKNNSPLSSEYSETKVTYKKGDLIIDSDSDIYMVSEEDGELILSKASIGSIERGIKKLYTIDASTNTFICKESDDYGNSYIYNLLVKDSSDNYTHIYDIKNDASLSGTIIEVEICNQKTGVVSIFIENEPNE